MLLFQRGQHIKVNWSLEEERQRAQALIARCPTLQRFQEKSEKSEKSEKGEVNVEWTLQNPEDCLELLSEL